MSGNKVPGLEWTPDCQGKWDYDGALVRVSTRYWPRGGGFHTFSREEGWRGNETRPEIKPHAHSAIILGDYDGSGNDGREIAEAEFTGETEAEVKAAVERWVAEQYQRIASLLAPEPAK